MMQLPNPESLLATLTAEIIKLVGKDTAIVGIHSGGVWIMERILDSLKQEIPYGTLDAALYRDDYAQLGLKDTIHPANIAFDVKDKHIILIDDIFYTGRTTRAAINELFDYGRPASVTLAVLIDRGNQQLPIKPQITGAYIPLKATQRFQLSKDKAGQLLLALEDKQDMNHV